MEDFKCPACGSPALVYPKVLEDVEPVVCASCRAFVSTYGQLKERFEHSPRHRIFSGCGRLFAIGIEPHPRARAISARTLEDQRLSFLSLNGLAHAKDRSSAPACADVLAAQWPTLSAGSRPALPTARTPRAFSP